MAKLLLRYWERHSTCYFELPQSTQNTYRSPKYFCYHHTRAWIPEFGCRNSCQNPFQHRLLRPGADRIHHTKVHLRGLHRRARTWRWGSIRFHDLIFQDAALLNNTAIDLPNPEAGGTYLIKITKYEHKLTMFIRFILYLLKSKLNCFDQPGAEASSRELIVAGLLQMPEVFAAMTEMPDSSESLLDSSSLEISALEPPDS